MTMAISHTRKFPQGDNDYGTHIQESFGNLSNINLCIYKYVHACVCMFVYINIST